jgi:diacylglycerol O-acyltransferase / wax synthase
MLQQLGVIDASFLYTETAETPMHVGSLYLYEPPSGYTGDFYEDFKAYIASRMHEFPVFTRKLAQLPFDLDAPFWIDDKAIDIDYHIRRATVPKPGGFAQLEELAAQLHSTLLDRTRPLWEIYIIDGLADGRVAELTKFHHAGFDGSAAMALTLLLYSTTPVAQPAPPPQPAREQEQQEQLDLIKLLDLMYTSPLRQYLRAMQAVPDFLKVWTKLWLIDPETLRLEPPELPPLAPWTRLNASISNQRSFAARTVSFKDIRRIAKHNGVTVNDTVLAICSAALRRYLGATGDLPSTSLTAFVPMSLRETGNTEMSIQTVGMLCSLATDIADPVKRLLAIHDSTQKAKRLTDTIKSVAFAVASPWGAPALVSGVMNLLGRYHLTDGLRPIANLTISNMVGSPVPLYLVGAKLLANYPMSIATHGAAVNVTVLSYGDNLDIGVVACRRAMPDVQDFADYIVDALDELSTASFKPAATVREPAGSARRGTKRPTTAKTMRAKRASRVAKPARAKAAPRPKPAAKESTRKFPYIVARNTTPAETERAGRSGKPAAADAAKASGERAATTPSPGGKSPAPSSSANRLEQDERRPPSSPTHR